MGMPHDGGSLPNSLRNRSDVLELALQRILLPVLACPATATIDGTNGELARKHGDHALPAVPACRYTGYQCQRRPLAVGSPADTGPISRNCIVDSFVPETIDVPLSMVSPLAVCQRLIRASASAIAHQ